MAERFAREPSFELRTLPVRGDDVMALASLAEAHAYQISSSRDELPSRWFATAELLARCPDLLVVSATGAGCDTVDIPACTAADVLVVNQSGANAQSVAEHTIGLMLAVSRRISESDRRMRTERGFTREELMGREITGKTLGLIGIGEIGRRVARMAKAFDMEVVATDPLLSPEEIDRRGARPVGIGELLRSANFVSLHCPRDATTVGLIDAAALAAMKPGAVLINTARGGIHDETAVAAALAEGRLGGAGLDVWDVEPPPLEHPLLAHLNVVATYHTAGVTPEARETMSRYAADQLVDLLKDGSRPPRLLNPEAWPRFAERFAAILGMAPGLPPSMPKDTSHA